MPLDAAPFVPAPRPLLLMPRIPSDPVFRSVLLFLLLWPPLHMMGTTALDVSSWRFGGWGMYASASPRRSNVAVVMRDCALPAGATQDSAGLHALVFEDRAVRKTRIAVDARAGALARDISALRRPDDALALGRRVRRLHRIDAQTPLLIAAVEPRVDMDRQVGFGFARTFVVTEDAVVDADAAAASLARFDALLPACEDSP